MIPKFRAWDKDKEWMVYDVQDTYDGLWSERNSDEVNDYYGYASTFQSFTDEEDFNFMQYTGLKDKNGVEIYEGDVVSANDGLFEGEIQRIGACFFARFIDTCNSYFFQPADWLNEFQNVIEVVGNIYENPELLEAQND